MNDGAAGDEWCLSWTVEVKNAAGEGGVGRVNIEPNISDLMAQVSFFFSLTFIFKVELLEMSIARKQWEIEQTLLLLSSNRKSCLGFQLVYLYFSLTHAKGQGHRHAYFAIIS